MDNKPRISIITPTTLSRSKFLPLLVNNVLSQNYPHELLEWVVVGDMDPRTKDIFLKIFEDIKLITCKYYECDIMDNIGRKRNFACSLAKSKIFANMDSDDFYQRSYLEYSIKTMKEHKVSLVGARDMLIFYPDIGGKMTFVRGVRAHEASMVYRKSHWAKYKYANVKNAEGVNLLIRGTYFNEVDIRQIMICFAHGDNTFNKDSLKDSTEVSISDDMREMIMKMYSTCESKNNVKS